MKVKVLWSIMKNMGVRYVIYRVYYALALKSGWYKIKFETSPKSISTLSLEEWRKRAPTFLIPRREDFRTIERHQDHIKLEQRVKNILEGKIPFFSWKVLDLGKDYDWLTNPLTSHKFQLDHWTKINDFDAKAGDIKYVWEKARFCYLIEVMRFDHIFQKDHSEFVIKEIVSFIDQNPVNCGPNWKCSQEISLRNMNWMMLLSFYRSSPFLTEEIFTKIINYQYWQLKHVYDNIQFSRIAVRNNHAITETLMLYLSQFHFSFFPESKKWGRKGKRWLQEEIDYQIYADGSHLQFSMNYQRVVVQLLTIAILSANKFGDELNVEKKASLCLEFMGSLQDKENGMLPNYGANDGALFFKFSEVSFRDYRPQLQALAFALGKSFGAEIFEDAQWLQLEGQVDLEMKEYSTRAFTEGGYFIIRGADSLTYIRCGNHPDRPSQADNLHLDLWAGHKNLMRDAGTFQYNGEPEMIKYYFGTSGHNAVTLGDFDQMEKGARFIWLNWTQAEYGKIEEFDDYFLFEGVIKAFQHISPDISHRRKVKCLKKGYRWEIEDTIVNKPQDLLMVQHWHPNPHVKGLEIEALSNGEQLRKQTKTGWYSEIYGQKDETPHWSFVTTSNEIQTKINLT